MKCLCPLLLSALFLAMFGVPPQSARGGEFARVAYLGTGAEEALKDMAIPYERVNHKFLGGPFSLDSYDLLVVCLRESDLQTNTLIPLLLENGDTVKEFVQAGGVLLVLMLPPEGISDRLLPFPVGRSGLTTHDIFTTEYRHPLFRGIKTNVLRTPCHATYGFVGLTHPAPDWKVLAKGDNNQTYLMEAFFGKGLVILSLVDAPSYYDQFFGSKAFTRNLFLYAQEFLLRNDRILKPFVTISGGKP